MTAWAKRQGKCKQKVISVLLEFLVDICSVLSRPFQCYGPFASTEQCTVSSHGNAELRLCTKVPKLWEKKKKDILEWKFKLRQQSRSRGKTRRLAILGKFTLGMYVKTIVLFVWQHRLCATRSLPKSKSPKMLLGSIACRRQWTEGIKCEVLLLSELFVSYLVKFAGCEVRVLWQLCFILAHPQLHTKLFYPFDIPSVFCVILLPWTLFPRQIFLGNSPQSSSLRYCCHWLSCSFPTVVFQGKGISV